MIINTILALCLVLSIFYFVQKGIDKRKKEKEVLKVKKKMDEDMKNISKKIENLNDSELLSGDRIELIQKEIKDLEEKGEHIELVPEKMGEEEDFTKHYKALILHSECISKTVMSRFNQESLESLLSEYTEGVSVLNDSMELNGLRLKEDYLSLKRAELTLIYGLVRDSNTKIPFLCITSEKENEYRIYEKRFFKTSDIKNETGFLAGIELTDKARAKSKTLFKALKKRKLSENCYSLKEKECEDIIKKYF